MTERIPIMPIIFNRIFGITKTRVTSQGSITSVVHHPINRPVCPSCAGRSVSFYDHYYRKALFDGNGSARLLKIKAKRYRCLSCGYLFRQRIEGLVGKRRSCESLRRRMAQDVSKGVSNRDTARRFRCSESLVEASVHEFYSRKCAEALSYSAPLMIGIDEHSIHKGRRFATTVADLGNHRVYDVIEGRGGASIESRLMSYGGRGKVRMVCMDLSSPYRAMVRRCFPNAKIVADRFHVIRMVNHHFMQLAKALAEEIKWKRPFLNALRRKRSNLTGRDRDNLDALFQKHEALGVCWKFKEDLNDLLRLRTQNVRQCARNITRLKAMMRQLAHEAP